jgi:hypothetical protein
MPHAITTEVIPIISTEQQFIEHVLYHVPPVPPLSMAEMLEASCEPMHHVWVKRVPADQSV